MGKTKEEIAPVEKRSLFGWVPTARDLITEYAETTLVLLYIFNGVAAFLVLFDLVDSSEAFNKVIGSVAFGFSIFALMAFINKGVKHQTSSKKGKR